LAIKDLRIAISYTILQKMIEPVKLICFIYKKFSLLRRIGQLIHFEHSDCAAQWYYIRFLPIFRT